MSDTAVEKDEKRKADREALRIAKVAKVAKVAKPSTSKEEEAAMIWTPPPPPTSYCEYHMQNARAALQQLKEYEVVRRVLQRCERGETSWGDVGSSHCAEIQALSMLLVALGHRALTDGVADGAALLRAMKHDPETVGLLAIDETGLNLAADSEEAADRLAYVRAGSVSQQVWK